MNTLAQEYLAPSNDFGLNYHSKPVFPEENPVFGCNPHPDFDEFSVPTTNEESSSSSEGEISQDLYVAPEIFIEKDHLNEMLNFISGMLMEEEDLVSKPCMLHDSLALQATEKSFYDLLHNNQNANSSTNVASLSDYNNLDFPSFGYSMTPFSASHSSSDHRQLDAVMSRGRRIEESTQFLINDDEFPTPETEHTTMKTFDSREMMGRDCLPNSRMSGKKNRYREEDDNDIFEVQRSYKQLANNIGESEPLELYDSVLLCSEFNHQEPGCGEADKEEGKKQSNVLSNRGRPRRVMEIVVKEVVVDLRSLLLQCAQAVANYDRRTVSDLLTCIRKHSSPHGDGYERVAHYFSNALEARTAGTGLVSCTGFLSKRISAAEILRAYNTYVTACPFRKVSNVLANRTIYKLALGATTMLHIIDFGILFGYQWPRLIQRLSKRPGGPPKLRITGIDFPQPGHQPAPRLAETGITLKKYCERFGVPFEYNGIAQKWETIKIKDLKIEKNELLVINSLYRLHNVPDETVRGSSPRDDVMNLIKKINPDIFIHGTINGNHNTPFFFTRFREALFHYSSMFDMFERTVSREDQNRVMFEEEVFGWDVMNIIACEGTERVERPETYKQWQVRCTRGGFKQLPLDQEIMNFVRCRVKTIYNKDFTVEEDGNWMLQGWKGRVNNALSFWRPAN